jgi:hypothetical protein
MSASIHTASDTRVSDNLSQQGIKPAMAVGHQGSAIQSAPTIGGVLPGVSPRGPGRPRADLLAGKIDVRLSGLLRQHLSAVAKAKGVTDGAYVRTLIADALGAAAPSDRMTAPRKREPSDTLVALAAAVREIGAAHGPLSRQPPDVTAAKVHLASAREGLAALIRVEARDV